MAKMRKKILNLSAPPSLLMEVTPMENKLHVKTQWMGYSDFCWNQFSPRVATISSAENQYHWDGGFITYIGYPTKPKATEAMKHLLKYQKADDVDMRKAKRMKQKGIRWELKVWGLRFDDVVKLATQDLADLKKNQMERSLESSPAKSNAPISKDLFSFV